MKVHKDSIGFVVVRPDGTLWSRRYGMEGGELIMFFSAKTIAERYVADAEPSDRLDGAILHEARRAYHVEKPV